MWYVIWAEGRYEHLLYDNINRNMDKELYDEIWLPEKTEHRKYRGKWRKVRRVLLPGYFFVNTDTPEKFYYSLKGYKGFIGLLRNEGSFTALTVREEEVLKKLSDPARSADISVGRLVDGKIEILDGPLMGMEQYIVSLDKHKRRVKLEMHLFNLTQTFSMGLVLTEE